MVTVPAGGVEEGQKFSVAPEGSNVLLERGSSIPVGHWRVRDLLVICNICNALLVVDYLNPQSIITFVEQGRYVCVLWSWVLPS